MDFSKLSANDKLALYGSIAALVGGILSYGIGLITVLAALAMGFIVLQPQVAANLKLPGSKGSLMLLTGGIAAVFGVLGAISWLGYSSSNTMQLIFSLIGAAGAALMGWAGWQAFQAEGGKFQLGMSGSGAGASPPPPPAAPMPPPMAEPPASAPMSPPMAEPMSPPMSEPMAGDADEDDRPQG